MRGEAVFMKLSLHLTQIMKAIMDLPQEDKQQYIIIIKWKEHVCA